MSTWRDLIKLAFVEINSYSVEDPPSAAHEKLAMDLLNEILDEWAGRRPFAYNVNFPAFTLTANHQPHLIGPGLSSPDFAAATPARIEGAAIVLTNSATPVDCPLAIRDDEWWQQKRVKTVTSGIPTDLYPGYDWPNVSLYLWPIPTVAFDIRLMLWVSIAQIAETDLTSTYAAPYGYPLAMRLTLAEMLCSPMSRPMPANLADRASKARRSIQIRNIKSPRANTTPFGGRGGSHGSYADGWSR
jgi:hypothetical protein